MKSEVHDCVRSTMFYYSETLVVEYRRIYKKKKYDKHVFLDV